jgi:hypothetical protein
MKNNMIFVTLIGVLAASGSGMPDAAGTAVNDTTN